MLFFEAIRKKLQGDDYNELLKAHFTKKWIKKYLEWFVAFNVQSSDFLQSLSNRDYIVWNFIQQDASQQEEDDDLIEKHERKMLLKLFYVQLLILFKFKYLSKYKVIAVTLVYLQKCKLENVSMTLLFIYQCIFPIWKQSLLICIYKMSHLKEVSIIDISIVNIFKDDCWEISKTSRIEYLRR